MRHIILVGLLLSGLLIAGGCVSIIDDGAAPGSRYAYWLYRGDEKQDKKAKDKLATAARDLTQQRFQAVRKQALPANLPGLRGYTLELANPLIVRPEAVLLPPEEIPQYDEISKWYVSMRGNASVQRKLSLNGAALNADWQKEASRVDGEMQKLDQQKTSLLGTTKQLVDAQKYEESDKKFAEAAAIDSEDAGLRSAYSGMERAWLGRRAEDVLAAAESTTVPKMREDLKLFHNKEASSAALVKQVLGQVDSVRKGLVELRDWSAPRPVFAEAFKGYQKRFDGAMMACADIRGKAWSEDLWLLVQSADYWHFYETAQSHVNQKKDGNELRLGDDELKALKVGLQAGYSENLPRAVSYYTEQANKSRIGRANGLAIVYWRIVNELVDYGVRIGCTVPENVTRAETSLGEMIKPVRDQMHQGFARRIVIPEFDSEENRDGRNVTRTLETVIRDAFSRPNESSAVYGVTVQRATGAPGAGQAGDYRLSGMIDGILVDPLPAFETDRPEMPVGREVTKHPNEDKRTRDDFPIVLRQEIWVYEKIMTEYAKKCSIRANFSVTREQNTVPLWRIEETYGKEKPLAKVVMVDKAVEWKFITIRKMEGTREKEMLPSEALPRNQSANLAPDRDIQKAAVGVICDGITVSLIPRIEAFPFEDLAQKTKAAKQAGNAVDAADAQGLYLEYLWLLTSDKDESPATPGNAWISGRERMTTRLGETSAPIWKSHGTKVPADMKHVWDDAVRLAHEVKLP